MGLSPASKYQITKIMAEIEGFLVPLSLASADESYTFLIMRGVSAHAEGWMSRYSSARQSLFIEIDAKALKSTSMHNAARMVKSCRNKPDQGRAGKQANIASSRDYDEAGTWTGMSNRLSTLDAVFSTVSNSTELIPKRAAASTFSARSSRYKMSCGAALSSSRQFR